METISSNNFKVVGATFMLQSGEQIEVVSYLTGEDQRNLGLVPKDKKSGVQVLYTFKVDGTEMTLKGKQASNWFRAHGVKVDGSGGGGNVVPFATKWAEFKTFICRGSAAELEAAAKELEAAAKVLREREAAAMNAEKNAAAKLLGYASYEAFLKAQKKAPKKGTK